MSNHVTRSAWAGHTPRRTIGSTAPRSTGAVQIRPIKTKADHREALKAINKLMNARASTPDGDRPDVLIKRRLAW